MSTKTVDPDEGSSNARELAVLFCDRLTQIIDRRPDVIRKGRGRINDFAAAFDIHYTTAYRLLNSESLPSCALLCSIADKFQVTESWLLGRGHDDVDVMLDESPVKIHILKPRSTESDLYATIPPSELPPGFDSSKLVYTRVFSENGEEEDVIVKMTAEPHEGKVHLIFDPQIDNTYLRRINVLPSRGELLCCTLDTGAMVTLKAADVVFGGKDGGKKLRIVGPVMARIRFGFRGD